MARWVRRPSTSEKKLCTMRIKWYSATRNETVVVSSVRSTCQDTESRLSLADTVAFSEEKKEEIRRERKKRAAVGVVGARPPPAAALVLLCSLTMCVATWSLGRHAGQLGGSQHGFAAMRAKLGRSTHRHARHAQQLGPRSRRSPAATAPPRPTGVHFPALPRATAGRTQRRPSPHATAGQPHPAPTTPAWTPHTTVGVAGRPPRRPSGCRRSMTETTRGLTPGPPGAAVRSTVRLRLGKPVGLCRIPPAAAVLAPHALLGHRQLAVAACCSSASTVAVSLGAGGEMVTAWELVRV
uniref:Uncharacterized protein n=1 Tax=Arundo donax TaxID=35708 RepID=A0A0A9HFA9_ARUDO